MKKKSKSQQMKVEDTGTFTCPESSNVEGAIYNDETQVMIAAFRDKKNPTAATLYYQYGGVSAEDWQGFKAAPSKGKFMSEVIKRKYQGVRM